MDKKTLDEVVECLEQEKTRFDYFKDGYAIRLLSYVAGKGKKIADIKQTPYARLLDKPLVKPLLAQAGDGILSADLLALAYLETPYTFLLTLASWGGDNRRWQQTSRNGYNLVLQLNFSNQHAVLYQHLVKPTRNVAFNYYSHPSMHTAKNGFFRETLAWARIDFDFATNEALIEEIQCDWIKRAQDTLDHILWSEEKAGRIRPTNIKGSTEALQTYMKTVLKPYIQLWDEAVLMAAITYIREELGIKTIFYHDYMTGSQLKNCEPPRSLYTTLPRRFCFQLTEDAPQFLQQDKPFQKAIRKVKTPHWFVLSF
ncbi:hypothetical protein [Beggiatoa leptomitoformis]|uniref:Uncharacterized protein n=1 Tax=Beggiatoa leptomitoformis TaxID=288004 RepID=A0A2N9YFJ1_9GAMM|nr:hypothetical protein [Beggiatoa leptomitoformis]ALG68435.1 hypothetical protein AL038_12925 [Beggiatoa leptomitoformis]AUI69233.1 hypothetical protein BLE401_11350 [Beggiatoa leptomitoformis]